MATQIFSGTVKFFDTNKNFGFITSEGKDIFFHISGTLDSVNKGDNVSFELQEGKKGKKAVNIRKEA